MSTGLDLSQFYDTFFDEASELLTDMEQLLLGLDVDNPDMDQLNAIFRAAHSIKGGAATFGCFGLLANTTHLLENILDGVRRGEMTLRQDMIDLFLETKDVLTDQVAAYRASQEPDVQAYERICAQLRQLAEEKNGVSSSQDESASTPAPASAGVAVSASTPTLADVQSCAAPQAQASDAVKSNAQPDGSAQGSAQSSLPLRIRLSHISPEDAAALKNEMALLGEILHTETHPDGLSIWLKTSESPSDIVAVCCFIIDEHQIDIAPQALPAAAMGASANQAPATSNPPAVKPGPAVQGHTPTSQTQTEQQSAQMAPAAQTATHAGQTSQAPQKTSPAANAKSASPAQKPAAPVKDSSTIRVGVEKVDQIINLVGELVITQAMLVQMASTLDPVLHDRLLNGIEQLDRNARDLQEAVMSIRMMPMDYVFSRFPRVVRENATKMGKRIRLVTQGQATELDKSLIERIIDPLTHLVRNSLDHGFELPEVRIAAGKDPEGTLTLSAQHNGGQIVIEVSDDGAGLSREKILKKAMAQGFPVNESTPDEELWQLIFAPGFSTAEVVTDISGRGVGMDVVRRNIQSMGGHVHLSSRAGQGTTTRIVLPLTLAILDGMSVRVGEETFILPLSHVTESLQPSPEQVHRISETEYVLHVRGEYLPIVPLHQVFDVAGAEQDISKSIAVILRAEKVRFALLVDHLIGQHQVVVKNLEANYRKIPGISAATILGDGSVALIVDVFALMRFSRERAAA